MIIAVVSAFLCVLSQRTDYPLLLSTAIRTLELAVSKPYARSDNRRVRFEILIAVVKKSTIFWNITPCSPLIVDECFGETYSLRLQGQRISRTLLSPAFTLLSCSAYSTLGGDMFLRSAVDFQLSTWRYISEGSKKK
jgi:hypothetical protein